MYMKVGEKLHDGDLSLGKEKGDCKRFRAVRAAPERRGRRLEKEPGTR
jgi:hypothetical protein